MKTLRFEDRESWLAARKGKITGSRLKDIIVKRGTGYKLGYYELIAERLAIVTGDEIIGETPMDRGTRLEKDAMARFIAETKKKVDTSLVIWTRDENESIAISPDGFIGNKVAVECKCLSSARHIEAYLTQKLPDEYEYQALQYFIVNDKLQTLHFVFYDPRIPVKDFFTLEIGRKENEEKIAEYLEYQKKTIEEVNAIVNSLTF